MGAEEAFYSPLIKYQPLSEPAPQDCGLHKCPHHLRWDRMARGTGVGCFLSAGLVRL